MEPCEGGVGGRGWAWVGVGAGRAGARGAGRAGVSGRARTRAPPPHPTPLHTPSPPRQAVVGVQHVHAGHVSTPPAEPTVSMFVEGRAAPAPAARRPAAVQGQGLHVTRGHGHAAPGQPWPARPQGGRRFRRTENGRLRAVRRPPVVQAHRVVSVGVRQETGGHAHAAGGSGPVVDCQGVPRRERDPDHLFPEGRRPAGAVSKHGKGLAGSKTWHSAAAACDGRVAEQGGRTRASTCLVHAMRSRACLGRSGVCAVWNVPPGGRRGAARRPVRGGRGVQCLMLRRGRRPTFQCCAARRPAAGPQAAAAAGPGPVQL